MSTVRPLRYHKAAAAELDDTAAWYESQREGLGGEFVAAVDATVARIVEAPERWPVVGRSRRVLVGRFPYTVVYRLLADGAIQVVAVAHVRRRPRYWSRR